VQDLQGFLQIPFTTGVEACTQRPDTRKRMVKVERLQGNEVKKPRCTVYMESVCVITHTRASVHTEVDMRQKKEEDMYTL